MIQRVAAALRSRVESRGRSLCCRRIESESIVARQLLLLLRLLLRGCGHREIRQEVDPKIHRRRCSGLHRRSGRSARHNTRRGKRGLLHNTSSTNTK